jgi:hypothetical protein
MREKGGANAGSTSTGGYAAVLAGDWDSDQQALVDPSK